MLCVMLLIQGIGQSYAAQMMTAKATTLVPAPMLQMPCHEVNTDSSATMSDCCDQDCQCQMMASVMIMSAIALPIRPKPSVVSEYTTSFFSAHSNNLYRPPILA
jgi:hypothetical protein